MCDNAVRCEKCKIFDPEKNRFFYWSLVKSFDSLLIPLKGITPGSMNSLFSDFFGEFWRGILGGVRDYLGEVLGGF